MQLGLPVLSWPRRGLPLRLPRRPQILAPGESPPPGGAGLRRLHARSRRRPLPERREKAPRARQPVDPLGRRALPDLTSGMFTPEKPAPKWAAPSRLHSTARSCRPACRRRERRQLRQGACASGDRSVVADVAAQGQRLERRRPHSDRRLLQPGEVDVSENQIRAPAREALGAAKIDARGRAGDQHPLAMT